MQASLEAADTQKPIELAKTSHFPDVVFEHVGKLANKGEIHTAVTTRCLRGAHHRFPSIVNTQCCGAGLEHLG